MKIRSFLRWLEQRFFFFKVRVLYPEKNPIKKRLFVVIDTNRKSHKKVKHLQTYVKQITTEGLKDAV